MPNVNDEIKLFKDNFAITAIVQGRIAYFLMSLHATNPNLLSSVFNIDPYPYLYANMVYGLGVLIYTRPSMRMINKFHRCTFSIMVSLMFNCSSILVFKWLNEHYSENPYLQLLLGYLSGRIMMIHFLAFFYHMDTRIYPSVVQRIDDFEDMYETV